MCCGGAILNRTSEKSGCCDQVAYNPREQICCLGRLYKLTTSTTYCCGANAVYDERTQRCCGENVVNITKSTEHCCLDKTYDTATQVISYARNTQFRPIFSCFLFFGIKEAIAPHIMRYRNIHYLEILECLFLYVKFMTEVAFDFSITF